MNASRLGRVGVWLGALSAARRDAERDAVRRLEHAGYTTIWFGEAAATREPFAHAALILGWTDRVVVATGIASVYARDAVTARRGAETLNEAFPDRFLLGLGVSHPPMVESRGARYEAPVTAMRRYLDAYDAAPASRFTPPATKPGVVIAALGPRMLALGGARTDGVHPYFVPPEHTALARETVGRGPLVLPEQAVLVEHDRDAARRIAREHTSYYLTLGNYRRNLERLGFSETDFADGGSDRLVDAIVAWGDEDAIVERVAAHLYAGADHVAVQAIGPDPLARLVSLAPALLRVDAR